ncbi:MAG: Uma2 family endonuclease [Cyclobacteriaceae bacterium]
MDTLVDQITQSPRLPQYLEEIQAFWRKEEDKRKQFYKEIVEDRKMEFINGETYFQSPVKLQHNEAGKLLLILMHTYAKANGLGFVGYEKMLVSLTRNDYEPDICFWGIEKSSQFKPRQMQFPAPDLVVEILSESTEKIDRGVKFEDYAQHQIREYWIVDADTQLVEQYVLEEGKYALKHKAQNQETIFCQVLSGFNIPAIAIFDETENVKVLKGHLVR